MPPRPRSAQGASPSAAARPRAPPARAAPLDAVLPSADPHRGAAPPRRLAGGDLPLVGPTGLAALTLGTASAETWRGLTVAPDHRRCSPYERKRDYPYPQSVEQDIVRALGAVYGPYTGTCFTSTRDSDIEHIVATSEAHDSGLCAADRTTRKRFAQDLRNLTLASPQVNRREKSGKDAGEWVPERNECWFAGRVLEVKRAYRLTVDRREAAALERIFSQCYGTEMELIACTAPSNARERPESRHLPGTMRSPATTTTGTAGSRARRRADTGSRPCKWSEDGGEDPQPLSDAMVIGIHEPDSLPRRFIRGTWRHLPPRGTQACLRSAASLGPH